MRDYKHIDQYITKLYADIYPQPEDDGHTRIAAEAIDNWMSKMTTCHSVLDVGCGTGFCQDFFQKWNVQYEGVCLGKDFLEAQKLGRSVRQMDFNFLEYPDNSFDLVFARHSLEHSPMPLLTMMEWHRVSKNWLGVIVPTPEWFTFKGKNHYSIMNIEQIKNLLDVSGWNILWEDIHDETWDTESHQTKPFEYRFMCEKKR